MSTWKKPILALALLTAAQAAWAQAPNDAQKAKDEADAQALYDQGDAKMKVASYDEAIDQFRTILKRYPATTVRYQAEFRMADALVQEKKDDDALNLLQTVVKEEDPDWSPKALEQIGDVYVGEQKYSDAFHAYRTIISDYPDSPMVDHAHFEIGITHFKLGHYEQASEELEKVGTAYASRVPDLQRVSPGEPLHVRITEPNMVAGPNTTLAATLTVKSGDRESVTLVPDTEGGDHFHASIPTKLGAATPNDGVLELYGNDTVTLHYKSRYIGGGGEDRSVTMPVASSARLLIKDSTGNEVRGIVVTNDMTVEVDDADRDVSDGRDTVEVRIKTKKKDEEKLTLTETGNHTGVFVGSIKVVKGDPTPNNGTIETNAGIAEGSATVLDDNISVTYIDEHHLEAGITGPRTVKSTVTIYADANGTVIPVNTEISRPDLEIKSLLYKGRSQNEIAATYRDLGQDLVAAKLFREAQDDFQAIIAKYPNAPEVEDAMYGLFQNYVGQEQYDSAIAVVTQIGQKFPQSSRAQDALFELAALHVKKEEYDRALGIYQSLLQRTKGTPLAEEANYDILTTYKAMLSHKATNGTSKNTGVSREQVSAALEEFARTYPNSKRTPEALFQLVSLRYDGEDFQGAADDARRMVALYPDDVMTGRVLLLQAQSLIKLRRTDEAEDVLRSIIANYGDMADQANKLLTGLEQRYGTHSAGSTTGGAK